MSPAHPLSEESKRINEKKKQYQKQNRSSSCEVKEATIIVVWVRYMLASESTSSEESAGMWEAWNDITNERGIIERTKTHVIMIWCGSQINGNNSCYVDRSHCKWKRGLITTRTGHNYICIRQVPFKSVHPPLNLIQINIHWCQFRRVESKKKRYYAKEHKKMKSCFKSAKIRRKSSDRACYSLKCAVQNMEGVEDKGA